MEHQYQGTIKFFNKEKGFGFIQSEQGEIFVHITGLEGYDPEKGYHGEYPKDGDAVAFNVAEGRKGLNAVDVRIIGGGAQAAHHENA
ncbi:MAG: cold shock domain-containing protein [Candidatus Absconditabacterales bacterium]